MSTLLSNPVIEERTVISGASESFAKGWRWRRIAERAGMTFGQDSAVSDLRGASRFCSPFSMRRKLWRSKGSITQVDSGDSPSAICGLTAAVVLLCFAPTVAVAQSAACGLTSVTESSALNYPPLAKAARIQGNVILLATFEHDGSVSATKLVGPSSDISRFLGELVTVYVRGWRANSYSGPRQCPVVVSFVVGKESDHPMTFLVRTDPQHVQITAQVSPESVQYSIASK